MKRFLTFAVLTIVTLGLISFIHVLFDLGEVDWVAIGIPVVILYYGSYGLTLPFVKSKEKK